MLLWQSNSLTAHIWATNCVRLVFCKSKVLHWLRRSPIRVLFPGCPPKWSKLHSSCNSGCLFRHNLEVVSKKCPSNQNSCKTKSQMSSLRSFKVLWSWNRMQRRHLWWRVDLLVKSSPQTQAHCFPCRQSFQSFHACRSQYKLCLQCSLFRSCEFGYAVWVRRGGYLSHLPNRPQEACLLCCTWQESVRICRLQLKSMS